MEGTGDRRRGGAGSGATALSQPPREAADGRLQAAVGAGGLERPGDIHTSSSGQQLHPQLAPHGLVLQPEGLDWKLRLRLPFPCIFPPGLPAPQPHARSHPHCHSHAPQHLWQPPPSPHTTKQSLASRTCHPHRTLASGTTDSSRGELTARTLPVPQAQAPFLPRVTMAACLPPSLAARCSRAAQFWPTQSAVQGRDLLPSLLQRLSRAEPGRQAAARMDGRESQDGKSLGPGSREL